MNRIFTFIACVVLSVLSIGSAFAADKSRGLWACYTTNGRNIFVSWRMRATDAPKTTTYKLYADGTLISTLTDCTNVTLSTSYANATFSLEVLDANGNIIDSQADVKLDGAFYHKIKLNHPANYIMPSGDTCVYSPNDASAYDMDGDGEQEIILSWTPSNIGALCTATAPPILDCYKLDGTMLWRINFGPNVLAGCRSTFLCYDFDGDGYGEVIGKTAQGSKDGTGNYLSKGVAAGANHSASSVNSSGVITDGGKEWITCFDGRTGKELATIDYWPYFNIQSDWDPSNKVDGSGYGHRGNWFKGCVASLPVNGTKKACAVTIRGIYTYSYAAAYSWDGKTLSNVWKHTSDVDGQGIYGEGAHSCASGDLDGDGYDEIFVGAAALDHDGKLLWRTGLGHGDATHLGEFDPSNPGLECFMITEETTSAYDCALIDGKTGKILMSKTQTGGDTSRGMILDCDSNHDGAEIMEWSDANLMDIDGNAISAWRVGSITSASINYRIFWDGDLYEDYHDRGHVDVWDSENKSWGRSMTFYSYGGGASSCNGTKYNCNLQCDLYGDWREEAVYWNTSDGDYYLVSYTSTVSSAYKLPWLRDDHTYDLAITWQNCGYDQPPHLGYSPVEYYKELNTVMPAATLTKNGAGSSTQTVNQGESIVDFAYTWTNATTVTVQGLPEGVNYTIDTNAKKVYISGTANDEPGKYQFVVSTVGNDTNAIKKGNIIIAFTDPAEIIKQGAGSSKQTVKQDSAIVDFCFAWKNANTVTVAGLPKGITVDIDETNKTVCFSGNANDEIGVYEYTVTTVGGITDSIRKGSFTIVYPEPATIDVQGDLSQTVYKDSAIASYTFSYAYADSFKVEGLPNGVSATAGTEGFVISGNANDEVGSYKFTVSTVGGNPDFSLEGTITIVEVPSTGVETVAAQSAMDVNPNPMVESAVVTLNGVEAENVAWTLASADGVICRKGETADSVFTISRNGLASGIYILSVTSNNFQAVTKLVVK